MKVVLLTHIDKLGNLGETIDVAEGFARNYLLPRNCACLLSDPRVRTACKRAIEEKSARPVSVKEQKTSKREKRIIRQVKEKEALHHNVLKEGKNGT